MPIKSEYKRINRNLIGILLIGFLISITLSYLTINGLKYRLNSIWENHTRLKFALINMGLSDQVSRLEIFSRVLLKGQKIDKATILETLPLIENTNSSYLGGLWIPISDQSAQTPTTANPQGLSKTNDQNRLMKRLTNESFINLIDASLGEASSVKSQIIHEFVSKNYLSNWQNSVDRDQVFSFPITLSGRQANTSNLILVLAQAIESSNLMPSSQGIWISLIDFDEAFLSTKEDYSEAGKFSFNHLVTPYSTGMINQATLSQINVFYKSPKGLLDVKISKAPEDEIGFIRSYLIKSVQREISLGKSTYQIEIVPQGAFDKLPVIFVITLLGSFMLTIAYAMSYRTRQVKLAIQKQDKMENEIVQKDEFFDTLAHELRTPLNGMIGMTELLSQTKLTPEQSYYANTVRLSGLSLRWTVDQTLTLSKLNTYDFEIQNEVMTLNTLLDSTLDILGPLARLKQLRFLYEISAELIDQEFLGDQLRIRQALINLVGNAIKHTQTGEIYIKVTPTNPELNMPPNFITFEIRDTGTGISKENQKIILNKFIRIHADAPSDTSEGGLGLHITMKIVKKMKGEFHFESQIKEGSRFFFHIPLEVVPSTLTQSDLLYHFANKKIGLIANSEDCIGSLGQSIRTHGGEITLISNYLEARKYFYGSKKSRYQMDLLVMDEVVDNTSGYDFYQQCNKWLQGNFEDKTLFLYSETSLNGRLYLNEAGIKNYVLKPINHLSLLKRMKDILANSFIVPLSENKSNTTQNSLFESKLKVLIADDNLVNLEILVLMLKKIGHFTETASNGDEVIDKLQSDDFDLILMDINMPGKTGVEASLEIRKLLDYKKDIPIIAMTANLGKEFEDFYFSKGMNGFIAKPIELEKLDQTINDVMGYV